MLNNSIYVVVHELSGHLFKLLFIKEWKQSLLHFNSTTFEIDNFVYPELIIFL